MISAAGQQFITGTQRQHTGQHQPQSTFLSFSIEMFEHFQRGTLTLNKAEMKTPKM